MKNSSAKDKSLESWIWDAACSIRGAKDAPKYKEFILPLIFAKRLCDVFDDELNRIAKEVGSRAKAFKLVKHDKKLVRFYLPLEPKSPDDPVWSVIRTLSVKIGEELTTHLRAIADANPLLKGIIDRVDFNATTHGVRDLDDDRLSNLIEAISAKRLGLADVEPDIIGRSYEYLIRKFAEGSVSSAGEFYTPTEVGFVIARVVDPQPGMEIYDPCCGSSGLLIKCQLVLNEKTQSQQKNGQPPLRLFGQEYIPETWAMSNMNMIIHDMEGEIELGDTFKNPKFRKNNRLRTFDRVVANPMWNQDWWKEADYDADEFDRFPKGAGYPGGKADWGWVQIIHASLKPRGRAAIVLDTGAASRASGNVNSNKEKDVRRWFIEQDIIEGVIQLPENLFYNTLSSGIILVLNKAKVVERRRRILLINAANEFTKGDPKNYLNEEAIVRISETFNDWNELENYSRILTLEEIARPSNDYNISPTRYVQLTNQKRYRSVVQIAHELEETNRRQEADRLALNEVVEQFIAVDTLGEGACEADLNHVPDGWHVVEFDRFATLQRGKDLTQAEFRKGDIPVAGSNGIIGYHDKANVKGPGVTVGRSGSVGKVAYYECDFWAHNTALYVKDFHGNDPRFVSYYLQALNLARFKSGASVPTLDRNQFRLMPILIPERSKQTAIARALLTVERNIAFTLSRKNTYEDLFCTLLHDLMTAKIRVGG